MFVPNQNSVKATTKHKRENGEMIKWLKNLLNKSIFAANQNRLPSFYNGS
jgi:hypothetical protein